VSIIPDTITGDVMRFREVAGSAKPGLIEVHIIIPGRGSSGWYEESVLQKACETGVYPSGMLMHWDHPTRQQEEDQPARVTGTIAAVLAEQGHYLEENNPDAWDGPGIYALAEVRPKFREDLKWLAGKIGVSHYVDGLSKEGEGPDGVKGRIITELLPSPFNSVDFVTIPGAGGHSRFAEVKLREKGRVPPNPTRNHGIATGSAGGCKHPLSYYTSKPWADLSESEKNQIASHFAYDDGSDTFQGLKLPHHNKAGDVEQNCVSAALQAIGGARTGTPMDLGGMTDEVKSHLQDHLDEIQQARKESMTGNQISIRLSEIMTSDPEVVEEIRKQVTEELQLESQTEEQKKKQAEAEARVRKRLTETEAQVKTLETENKDLKKKIAESAAREYASAEIAKVKLPESVSKSLVESLIKQVVLTEDGALDATKFGLIVSDEIKAKQTEIADILKESGVSAVHDNGSVSLGTGDVGKERENYRDTLIENGMTREQANRLAGIKEA
jgi:hypothetical protein